MDICKQNLPIEMVRNDLDNVPSFPLPSGFRFRFFQPGDETLWLEIQSATELHRKIYPGLFTKTFGSETTLLTQRQLYILDKSGKAVGTGTAWFDNHFHGQRFGRVHWVAIRPEFQGQGLSKALMTAICERLRELGHRKTYLRTSTARIPAINLYLRFGFRPLISNPNGERAWTQLRPKLKYPPEHAYRFSPKKPARRNRSVPL